MPLRVYWGFFGRISWLNLKKGRKEKAATQASSRDSETSSPEDKKKRSEFSEDGDVGDALNMSVSENIQHILERLGKLDTLETLLTKSLAKLEKLETRVNDLVETLEVKCRGHDKSLGEVKASAEFINQQFEQNKILFNAKTLEDFKKQESKIHQISKEQLYVEAYSRRENLIITGIPEVQDATEDTLQVLQRALHGERIKCHRCS